LQFAEIDVLDGRSCRIQSPGVDFENYMCVKDTEDQSSGSCRVSTLNFTMISRLSEML